MKKQYIIRPIPWFELVEQVFDEKTQQWVDNMFMCRDSKEICEKYQKEREKWDKIHHDNTK